MKRLLTIGVLALAGMAIGCSSGKKEPTKAAVDYAPPPAAPMHDATGGMQVTQVSTPAGGGVVSNAGMDRPAPQFVEPAPARGTKYVVKKGDTLWSIATKTYNDGKQYKKICAANPSIKGERVMVGQTIVLP